MVPPFDYYIRPFVKRRDLVTTTRKVTVGGTHDYATIDSKLRVVNVKTKLCDIILSIAEGVNRRPFERCFKCHLVLTLLPNTDRVTGYQGSEILVKTGTLINSLIKSPLPIRLSVLT